jgi:hypothetical protein
MKVSKNKKYIAVGLEIYILTLTQYKKARKLIDCNYSQTNTENFYAGLDYVREVGIFAFELDDMFNY